jgi:uncharacterized protein
MDRSEAINKVRLYKLLLSNYIQFDKVYLYGSYANETNLNDSDIDVAIVVSDITGDFFDINPLLWKLRRQIDDRIEPILIDKNNDKSGFLNIIEHTGIEID